MNYIKNIGISLLFITGTILVLTLLVSIFNYFNIISGSVLSISKILICIISLFVGGFVIGRKTNKKGWLEGLKLSVIFLIIFMIFNFLAFNNIPSFKNLIYYLIIITSCMFGSIIGINLNKK